MAFEIPGQLITLNSGSTAVAQFRAVSMGASGVTLPGSTADTKTVGVAQIGEDSTTAGGAITVMINGVSKLEAAGSTMAAGDAFGVNAAGRAIPLAGNATHKGVVVAGSSGTTGRILTVLWAPIA